LPKVLDGYIAHCNEKLHTEFRYEESLYLVRAAVDELAKALMEKGTYAVPYADLQLRIDDIVLAHIGQKSTPEYFQFPRRIN
jgi:hypothetical protein